MNTSDNIVLSRDALEITLARPDTFYRGTRFDWNGVFRRVECNGITYCDNWFDVEDPLRHDNVCGPSEEFFGCYGYDSSKIGEGFLKVGVGLLKRDSEGPYDWFHRYEILDGGHRSVEVGSDFVKFSHEMPGIYSYQKTIELTGPDSFRILHRMTTAQQMTLNQYCHNFFTFGLKSVEAGRSVEFNAPISGHFREDNENAACDSNRIYIKSNVLPGKLCYMGDIQSSSSNNYSFVLKSGLRSVRAECSLPMATSAFWSNHRVFCPEPFLEIQTSPDTPLEWSIDYKLF